MNVSGKIKLLRKDFENGASYSTNISNKKQDGTYSNLYVNVQLPKGTDLEDKIMLNITKGFLSNYTDKNGLAKIKIVVQEYNFEDSYEQEERFAIQNETNFIASDDLSDLPF